MYSDYYKKALIKLKEVEGALSDDSNDSANIDGGVHTAFGITKKYYPKEFNDVIKAHNSGNEGLKHSLIKDFYYKNFWDDWFDKFELFDLANICFSFGVNTSPRTSVKLLQTTLIYFYNVDLVIDGCLGKNTVNSINRMSNFYQKSLLTDYKFFININYLFNQFDPSTRKKFWKTILNEPRNHNKNNIVGWLNRFA